MDKEIEKLKKWAPKHVDFKPKRCLKNGKAIYNAEVKFLLELMRGGEEPPKTQDTEELREVAEYNKAKDESDDDEDEDEDEEEEELEEDEVNLDKLKAFYYRGGRENVEMKKCSKKGEICKCTRWHLIVDFDYYSLVDSSVTMFEMLKGNGFDTDGPVMVGKFFDKNGDLVGRYKWDAVKEEYSINFKD